jgi:hypothetical protein
MEYNLKEENFEIPPQKSFSSPNPRPITMLRSWYCTDGKKDQWGHVISAILDLSNLFIILSTFIKWM